VLYVIAGLEEPHGLAIKDELEEYYAKEVHHGQVYPNLDTLVDEGLVDKANSTGGRTSIRSLSERGGRSRPGVSGKRNTSRSKPEPLYGGVYDDPPWAVVPSSVGSVEPFRA
jgi:PadR family transcriptional regulator, regulatory protein PadR